MLLVSGGRVLLTPHRAQGQPPEHCRQGRVRGIRKPGPGGCVRPGLRGRPAHRASGLQASVPSHGLVGCWTSPFLKHTIICLHPRPCTLHGTLVPWQTPSSEAVGLFLESPKP